MSNGESGDCLPDRLIKLGRYDWPASATRQTISHLGERYWARFRGKEPKERIAPEGLGAMESPFPIVEDEAKLRSLLSAMLDRAFLEWATEADGSGGARALVTPPADFAILQEWADRHDFATLSGLPSLDELEKVFRTDERPLVIADLGGTFHRTYDGLDRLRVLLETMVRSDRKVLVGCCSWTWQFLKQAVHVDLVLPDARTFPAFDAEALAYLMQKAKDRNHETYCLRSGSSGADVFSRDEDGQLKDPFFQQLAEWSLGIAWIAYGIMASSIRRAPEDDDAEEAKATDLWLRDWEPTPLPDGDKRSALFVVHSLLIHGSLPEDLLFATLPRGVPRAVVPALEHGGILCRKDGRLSCASGFYPMIRNELSAAGFPLDKL